MTKKRNKPFIFDADSVIPADCDNHFHHIVQDHSLMKVHDGLAFLAKMFSLIPGNHSFDFRKTTREYYVHTDNEEVLQESKKQKFLLAGIPVVITSNPSKSMGITSKEFHERDDHYVHGKASQNTPNDEMEWLEQVSRLLSLLPESKFCDVSGTVPDPSKNKPYILFFEDAHFARLFSALDIEYYGIRLEALPMSREISED